MKNEKHIQTICYSEPYYYGEALKLCLGDNEIRNFILLTFSSEGQVGITGLNRTSE